MLHIPIIRQLANYRSLSHPELEDWDGLVSLGFYSEDKLLQLSRYFLGIPSA